MKQITDFVKIRVDQLIEDGRHFIYQDGQVKWNPETLEEFYKADEKFREPIITIINDEVGLHNWAIRFRPFFTGQYEVYIYCDTDQEYHKIEYIILDKLKSSFKSFHHAGTVADYLENYKQTK